MKFKCGDKIKRNMGKKEPRIKDGKKQVALVCFLLLSIVDIITQQIIVGALTCPGKRCPPGRAKRVKDTIVGVDGK